MCPGMETQRTRSNRPPIRPLARLAMLAAFGLWLFMAGGCAMLPFAITTTASLAMPQTASLAMTGVKGAYNTALIAADERDVNTIMRDNMLSLKAKSALLAARGHDEVQVRAYNGDLYAVGTVDAQEDRERIVAAMQNVKGVAAVKGYIRLRENDPARTSLADASLENHAKLALARHLLHKNAGIEVQAVNGQLCLMGGVGTHAEALDLIQFVETTTGARALSLLAIRDEYATGRSQTNRLYLLTPTPEPETRGLTLRDEPVALPGSPLRLGPALAENARPAAAPAAGGPAYRAKVTPPQAIAAAHSGPAQLRPALNKARAFAQHRLAAYAQAESNPAARAELLALADHVAQDRDLSISDRLSVAAAQATQQQSKARIQALLAMY